MPLDRRTFLGAATAGVLPGRLASPAQIIDTHTHFYDPSRPQGVPWPRKDETLLYRRVLPAEFRKLAAPLGVTGTVVIEASPWLEDNQWLLDLAAKDPIIVGVVGNLAAGNPEFPRHLARFAANRLFRGIRLNGRAIGEGLRTGPFVSHMKQLSGAELELDAAGAPSMLPDLVRLSDRVPELRIVIDHLPFDPPMDKAALRELGRRPRVYAKVSNVLRRKDGRVPLELSFYREALDELWTLFGPDRVVYGSNWPVSDLVAPYAAVHAVVAEYVAAKGRQAADKFFWKNSLAAYRWVKR